MKLLLLCSRTSWLVLLLMLLDLKLYSQVIDEWSLLAADELIGGPTHSENTLSGASVITKSSMLSPKVGSETHWMRKLSFIVFKISLALENLRELIIPP